MSTDGTDINDFEIINDQGVSVPLPKKSSQFIFGDNHIFTRIQLTDDKWKLLLKANKEINKETATDFRTTLSPREYAALKQGRLLEAIAKLQNPRRPFDPKECIKVITKADKNGNEQVALLVRTDLGDLILRDSIGETGSDEIKQWHDTDWTVDRSTPMPSKSINYLRIDGTHERPVNRMPLTDDKWRLLLTINERINNLKSPYGTVFSAKEYAEKKQKSLFTEDVLERLQDPQRPFNPKDCIKVVSGRDGRGQEQFALVLRTDRGDLVLRDSVGKTGSKEIKQWHDTDWRVDTEALPPAPRTLPYPPLPTKSTRYIALAPSSAVHLPEDNGLRRHREKMYPSGLNWTPQHQRRVTLTDELWRHLHDVHREINRRKQWNGEPYGAGDYALTKQQELFSSRRWPDEALSLASALDINGNEKLVLVVHTDRGDLVLRDNLDGKGDRIEQWHDLTSWTLTAMQSPKGRLRMDPVLSVGPSATTVVRPGGTLSTLQRTADQGGDTVTYRLGKGLNDAGQPSIVTFGTTLDTQEESTIYTVTNGKETLSVSSWHIDERGNLDSDPEQHRIVFRIRRPGKKDNLTVVNLPPPKESYLSEPCSPIEIKPCSFSGFFINLPKEDIKDFQETAKKLGIKLQPKTSGQATSIAVPSVADIRDAADKSLYQR